MQNYNTKNAVMQGANALNYSRTHTSCKPHSRCKKIHECETCHKIHAKKSLDKHLSHITDKQLKKFKYAKYITITPKDLVKDFDIHNSNIDIYNQYLTNSSKRRSKKHPFYNSEYISFKEITKSKGNKELLPHLHIILLTNNLPLFESQLFDFDIIDIKIELDEKYKKYNDYNNPLTTTLKKIYSYSTKADKSRLSYERIFNISKGKSDTKVSNIFKTKPKKSHILLPIHIEKKAEIRKALADGRKKALQAHKKYKAIRGNINTKEVHIHAIKTRKRIEKLSNIKKAQISRLNRFLKRFSVRAERNRSRTHDIK